MRSSAISLDQTGSKLRKVSRCRPAVSNESIPATRQEFSSQKLLPYKA